MATIFSFSGSFFGTRSFTDPATWYGGIVPTASDNVFIRGVRTTVNGALMYWPGTASFINVASNVGFPFSGSLYTYTDRDVEVKIDYNGLNGTTQFTECIIDKTFSAPWGQGDYNLNLYPFPDKRGGVIPNGAYALFRPGEITVSGSTIQVNDTLANFQWLDCNNKYSKIDGANGFSYTANSNGDYTVQITKGACVDTSECVNINSIGIVENDFGASLIIYPNPTKGNFSIDLGAFYYGVNVFVRDSKGQLIESRSFDHTRLIYSEIKGAEGYYFIQVTTSNNKTVSFKVLKQ